MEPGWKECVVGMARIARGFPGLLAGAGPGWRAPALFGPLFSPLPLSLRALAWLTRGRMDPEESSWLLLLEIPDSRF